jgi:hypothetical protein
MALRRVAVPVVEEVAAEPSVLLHVADHRLDGRPAPQAALDMGRQPPLLAGAEHADRLIVAVPAVAFVDKGALGLQAGDSSASNIAPPGSALRFGHETRERSK